MKRAKAGPPKARKSKAKARATQAGFPGFTDAEDPARALADELTMTHGRSCTVAGLDEAGRGPLAGPVVAGACVLPVPLPEALWALNDSKQLSPEQREALYPLIVEHALAFGVGVVEVERIDAINILRASLEAMAIAFAQCCVVLGRPIEGAVIDGNMRAPLPEDVVQRTVVGGDARSRPIMAASILAKVTRDRRMQQEHARFPGYGFAAHKGYGTPHHLEALARLGASPLHRRSFAPVRAALLGVDPASPDTASPRLFPVDVGITLEVLPGAAGAPSEPAP